ncbi:MAG: hypothetical protein ALECFALPRED_001410 [Alectoria fallacina]|uniref:Uncharacterized protein n=1 Tax=Alectoria fallacina TaxID=1903189 RepID=A0A8H3IND0_9LECA|nr:MAG: hypothetical protein ALECFALPRED_001410 [Alectoria fallacina]
MPRSRHSREDRVTVRSGYVSQDNNPVDHRGGPESHSGRINHARMNQRADPDTLLPSLDPRSRSLHIRNDMLFSSTASDLSEIPSRDDLPRSEPSQEYERRTRGYNPGYFGERVSKFSSSPQLGGLDRDYRDEGDWPHDSPIKIDYNGYKQDGKRGHRQAESYESDEKEWEKSKGSTAYLPPHLRDEDSFDQRQGLAAAQASRTYQTASEKRNDHNNDYIGHWPRKQRDGHKKAVDTARKRSIAYGDRSQRHRDSRDDRWRENWQTDLDKFYPEDDY